MAFKKKSFFALDCDEAVLFQSPESKVRFPVVPFFGMDYQKSSNF